MKAELFFYGLVTLVSQQVGPENAVTLNAVTLAPQGNFVSEVACDNGIKEPMQVIFNETRHMKEGSRILHRQQGMCFEVVPEDEATYTLVTELTASYAGLRFQVGDRAYIPLFRDKGHCNSALDSLDGLIPHGGEAYLIVSGKCISQK